MSTTQRQEDVDYSESARFDRFDGFDRGDLDWDYEAAQIATWEAERADEIRAYLVRHEAELADQIARRDSATATSTHYLASQRIQVLQKAIAGFRRELGQS